MRRAPSAKPEDLASLPPFDAAFERLVAKVGAETPADEMLALHRAFEARTGPFGPDDPWFESRSRAFWDDTMTGGAATVVRALSSVEASDRPWAEALPYAHRGLFQSSEDESAFLLVDVLSGAELVVHEVDGASRDALGSNAGLFDGRVVAIASPPRLALLPGAIFHPEGADEAIAAVASAARERGMATAALLDALLRMELSLRSLSRVKLSYAYRASALAG
jgi:hypothetical protein